MTAPLRDEITGAFIYPANDNIGARHSHTLARRVHPAGLRIEAEIQFNLWRYPRVLPANLKSHDRDTVTPTAARRHR
jgi:hypothetical protein